MSRARAKGTQGENYFLPILRDLFYPGITDGGVTDTKHPLQRLDNAARGERGVDGDYTGVPFLHEAKHTDKPSLTAWVRTARKKAGTNWVLLWKGDMRTLDGQPIVVMPLEKYLELMKMRRSVLNRLALVAGD